MNIEKVLVPEYKELIKIWEGSVRATHDFLTESDILFYREMLTKQNFKGIELFCIKNDRKEILAFMGILEDKIEMLFVCPFHIRKGLGSELIKYAVEKCKVKKVDVNEQNHKALKFYEELGFKLLSRSESDEAGNPFPILHLSLIDN